MVGRSGLLAALLLVGSPLAAQDNSIAPAPAPSAADNIGPRELSNFSLNGTVTREAEPAAQQPAPSARDSSTRAAASAPITDERPAPVRSAAVEAQPDRQRQNVAIDAIPSRPNLARNSSQLAGVGAAAPAFPAPAPAAPLADEASSGFSPLPWIAALLLLGAGAVVYFGRQRQKHRYAVSGASEFVGQVAEPLRPPSRAPDPQPVAPRPEPRQAPPPAMPEGLVKSNLRTAPKTPPGIVTASLRPWIELELEPSKALVTDEQAAIAFDVTLYNSGSAPARDIAVETCLINAGDQQDLELSQFYTAPGEVRDRIPTVAPLARITLKSAVRLPRSAIHEYEVEGRKLFMPMVAVNSRYRWSSGEGQSAASFLVGRAANDSAKLAPLRLDQGARGWKGLAARRYEKGIRR